MSVVKHVKLLVIEAIGVVGILPTALIDEEQLHKRHTNIMKGPTRFIFILYYTEILRTTRPISSHKRVPIRLRTRETTSVTRTNRFRFFR